jgi:hypothetical protein
VSWPINVAWPVRKHRWSWFGTLCQWIMRVRVVYITWYGSCARRVWGFGNFWTGNLAKKTCQMQF